MNRLEAGFSRLDITPMLGIGMCGYFQVRNAQGVLDPLEVNALALSCGEEKLLLISLDTGEVNTWTMDWLRQAVHEATGVPLPFLSYGVSSLTTNMLLAGVLLNINVRHTRLQF